MYQNAEGRDQLRQNLRATAAEHTIDGFKIELESLIANHLEAIEKHGDAIDRKIQEFLSEHGTQTVAGQDDISKKFQAKVATKIDLWIGADDILSNKFSQLFEDYEKYIDGKLLSKAATEVVEEMIKEIEEHVKEANDYGTSWTDQRDNAGIVLSQDKKGTIIKSTIDWFRELTKAELIRIYTNG